MIALDSLLDAGANPNAQELRFGQTPMHMAAVLGNEPLLEKLIQAGGRWELTRRDGSSGRDLLRRFHPNSTMLNHE
jgi:ankyrin repeat protein